MWEEHENKKLETLNHTYFEKHCGENTRLDVYFY